MKKPKYRDAACCRNCKYSDIDVFGRGTIGYKCTKYNGRCNKFKVCDSYVWMYDEEPSAKVPDLQYFLTFARDEAAKAIGRKIIEEDMRRALGILKTDGQPLPEDSVIFQKGVAEGRRLEREDERMRRAER